MGTTERLREDLKFSLKSANPFRAGVLRLLLAELYNKEKEKLAKSKSVLDEDEVISILQREAKKRKEAAELFKKGGRVDLVRKEGEELKIIEEYLPKQLPLEEVRAFVESLISRGLRDFNSLMKESMKELKGKVDGQVLAGVIKEMLK